VGLFAIEANSSDRLLDVRPPWVVISCAGQEEQVLGSVAPSRPRAEVWLRQLYRSHFDEVMRLILRFGVTHHDAEDLSQRVFMVAHRHSNQLDEIERPDAWLRAITVRVVREYYRWWRVRRTASWLLEHSWASHVRDDLTPEREALAGESLDQVRSVLLRMSHKLREALVLLDIEDLSPREAADLLGIPPNTLRSRRALAREEFRRLWERAQRQEGSQDE